MKKNQVLMGMLTLLLCSAAQANHLFWAGDFFNAGDDWAVAANWYNAEHNGGAIGPSPTAPGAVDHVIIDETVGGFPIAPAPSISSDVGSVQYLTAGWSAVGTSSLTIGDGGSLAVPTGGFTRFGHLVDALGILNITGAGYLVSDTLHVGYNSVAEAAGGSGVVNLSDDATLHVNSLGFGQEFVDYAIGTDQDGTGIIQMDGQARIIYNGDQISNGRADQLINSAWITAVGAGDYIIATHDASSSWTVFTVAPEPATVVCAAFGLLLLRRRG